MRNMQRKRRMDMNRQMQRNINIKETDAEENKKTIHKQGGEETYTYTEAETESYKEKYKRDV